MIIEVMPVGPVAANCLLLGCPETRQALIIDPGGDPDLILSRLDQHQLTIQGLLLTHAHFDHLLAIGDLKAKRGGTIMMHEGDRPLYENITVQGQLYGFEVPPLPPIDRYVQDGEIVTWGQHQAKILHTPGHSPGGLCLYVKSENLLVTGDTLFAGSIGRTDLWGGSYDLLMTSIRSQLLPLPDATRVIPGHGDSTTLGEERRSNPFLMESKRP